MARLTRLIGLLGLVFIAASAQAGILELRGGVGMTASDPDAFEKKVNTTSGGGLEADDLESFHADAFINIPALPIGVGVRYEMANQDQMSGTTKWDLDVQNLSLLVDWRLIDTLVYVGPIVSVGYPWADLKFVNGGTTTSNRINPDNLSYGAGLEAGVKLSRFLVGAEAGYQSLKLEAPSTPSAKAKVDLSGFYGKVMVGLSFF